MIIVENSILIRKPSEEVFDFLEYFENIPLWNYNVREVKQTQDGNGNKKRYYQKRNHDSQTFEIVEREYSEKLRI